MQRRRTRRVTGRSRTVAHGFPPVVTAAAGPSAQPPGFRSAAGTAGGPSASDPAVDGRGPLRILVVDDNQINRDVAAGVLRRAGHSVTVAGDGERAVQLAGEQDLDLVLMDIQMPAVDGLTATRLIRALPAPRGRVPVIALTAHASERSRTDCIAAGMDGFLTKPLRLKALFTEIALVVPGPEDRGIPEDAVAAPSPDDLLDREQMAMMADALGGDDWRSSLAGFADAARGELNQLAAAVRDGTDHHRLAHTLKGMAWNVGARRLGEMARELEAGLPADEQRHVDAMFVVLDLTLRAMNLS